MTRPDIVTALTGGLRLPAHLATAETVGALSPTPSRVGLVIGQDRRGMPVAIRLFREQPTSVLLVGGVWVAGLLAFRAFALGVRVAVHTAAPAWWAALGRAAGAPPDQLVLGDEPPLPRTTGAMPAVLEILEQRAAAVAHRPWHARLTVVADLSRHQPDELRAVDCVFLQCLSPGDAAKTALAWQLGPEAATLLQRLEGDMIAVVGGGADRYVWLSPTAVERQVLGLPESEIP
jgi:hypothetical protein